MAKNMARIENGVVVNVEWCHDNTAETDLLKNMYDLPVIISDTWKDGKFYRGTEEVIALIPETIVSNENSATSEDRDALDFST